MRHLRASMTVKIMSYVDMSYSVSQVSYFGALPALTPTLVTRPRRLGARAVRLRPAWRSQARDKYSRDLVEL